MNILQRSATIKRLREMAERLPDGSFDRVAVNAAVGDMMLQIPGQVKYGGGAWRCFECGAAVQPRVNHCGHCGKRLEWPTAEEVHGGAVMTELERRALLGDQKAQEECTRQGILLPCPCCNDEQSAHGDFQNFEYVQCLTCGLEIKIVKGNGWPSAISRWNTRPAPPVGWISVKERLPDDQGDVLVIAYWHEKWQVMMGWYGSKISKQWRIITPHGEKHPGGVTHWMPLPEPPKEDA